MASVPSSLLPTSAVSSSAEATATASNPSASAGDAVASATFAADDDLAGAHPRQQYVDHTYHDYVNVDEDDLRPITGRKGSGGGAAATMHKAMLGTTRGSYGPMMKEKGGSVMMPFPGKLLDVLDRGDLSTIIDWMPHGRAFIVKQPKVFATQVLPRFFKQTKFLSFTRQLNLWGFKRITRGLDAGAYYHELFLPGRPNLVLRMKRQKIKGTGVRPIPNPDGEPNFYYNYPRVPMVQRSGMPLPLPPLPSERMASLLNPGGAPRPQSVLSQGLQLQSLPPQVAAGMPQAFAMAPVSGSGVRNLGSLPAPNDALGNYLKANPPQNNLSATAAAEQRLIGIMNPRSTPSRFGSLSTGPNPLPSNVTGLPELLTRAAGPTIMTGLSKSLARADLLSSLRGDSISSQAPRDFRPSAKDVQDEVSRANQRLMDRLLGQTASAPAPQDLLGRDVRRPSFQAGLLTGNDANLLASPACSTPVNFQASLLAGNNTSLLGKRAHYMPSTPSGSLPPRKRSSFRHGLTNDRAMAPNYSHFGAQDLGVYMPPQRMGSSPASFQQSGLPSGLPNSMSSQAQDINVDTVTHALREAQHLENLARSQKARARALAGALHQQMGGQDLTLPFKTFDDKKWFDEQK